jgi:hypothetical protein
VFLKSALRAEKRLRLKAAQRADGLMGINRTGRNVRSSEYMVNMYAKLYASSVYRR